MVRLTNSLRLTYRFTIYVSGFLFRLAWTTTVPSLTLSQKMSAPEEPLAVFWRGRLTGWFRAVAGVVALLVPTATSSVAQVLPAEPFALAGGRLVISGEVAAAIAPEDTGYFNYTDYEQSALRQVRAGLTTALSLGAKASVLGEVRTETGKAFDVYAMFLRFRPWDERTVDVQVGRIPPTFGAFSRRDYGIDNPLIGYHLAYQ